MKCILTSYIDLYDKDIITDERIAERKHGSLEGKSVDVTDREEYWNYYTDVKYAMLGRLRYSRTLRWVVFSSFFSKLKEYLKNNSYNCYVKEIKLNKINDVFNRIDRIYKYPKQEELLVFEEKQLDKFVKDVVSSFCKEYRYLLDNY